MRAQVEAVAQEAQLIGKDNPGRKSGGKGFRLGNPGETKKSLGQFSGQLGPVSGQQEITILGSDNPELLISTANKIVDEMATLSEVRANNPR